MCSSFLHQSFGFSQAAPMKPFCPNPCHTMADDFVDMDLSFLRKSASEHVVTEQGEEIVASLEKIPEEDASNFQFFIQARFKAFFEEEVTPRMKTMMSAQQWQGVYARTESQAAVWSYLHWKNILGEAEVACSSLDQAQIASLSQLQYSEEGHEKFQLQVEEKIKTWLKTLPTELRKDVEENILLKAWRKEHFLGTVVDFFGRKQPSMPSAPATPPSLLSKSSLLMSTPEKRSRSTAAFSENNGASPAKCRTMDTENADTKFTPLDKVATSHKLRYDVMGKVLMVGNIVNLKIGPNKDRSLPKFSYILGSPVGTLEISAVGQIVQRTLEQVNALKGQVVSLSNTQFEKRYGTLSHGPNSLIQAIDGYEEEFENVDFKVEALENVGTFKAWSRLSVIGCIRELQEPTASERHSGQCYVDFLLQSPHGAGVSVRLSGPSSAMPCLEEDKEVFFKNFKVNSDKEQLYGDLTDMSELCIWPGASLGIYPLAVTQAVSWQTR